MGNIFRILIFMIVFAELSVAAEESNIGTVVELNGKVILTRDNKNEILTVQKTVNESDSIRTSKKGYAQILMKDDTLVKLSQNTSLNLVEFKSENQKNRQVTYDLELGKIRVLVNQKLGKGHIKLKTRALTLGVRGTEFLVNSYLGKGKYETDVAVLEGVVEIFILNKNGVPVPGMNIQLNPGEYLNSTKANEVGVSLAVQQIPYDVFTALKSKADTFLENKKMKVIETPNFDKAPKTPTSKDEDTSSDGSTIKEPTSGSTDLEETVESNYEVVEDGLNNLNDEFIEQTIISAEDELEDILNKAEESVDISIDRTDSDVPTSSGGGTDQATDQATRQAEREAAKAARSADREVARAERDAAKAERAAQQSIDKAEREAEREERKNSRGN
ncbi:FecR domain-containing protein [Bacteriovorax sp. Seq25_V]|uniref:FecR family protein n=1 Tax=Bacteriovorax sp. Seq25_V TaxID=1201288 RepID=UPI000A06090B|nr:FecR family protein [Bacteriovorax sp. Seq25_V]